MFKVGIGYDVHQLVENRDLVIGGVHIPHHKGLLGHSDADVLVHAIMDALLGALSLGSIGHLFPDTDPQYSGADSLKLLQHTYKAITDRDYRLGNIDSVIIAQKPKLNSHISEMVLNISSAINVPSSSIGIKATTTEKLGPEGREEGISAQAIVFLVKNT